MEIMGRRNPRSRIRTSSLDQRHGTLAGVWAAICALPRAYHLAALGAVGVFVLALLLLVLPSRIVLGIAATALGLGMLTRDYLSRRPDSRRRKRRSSSR